jgi:hypothetical protein
MHFLGMNKRQRARYLAWAEPFHATIGSAAGSMSGNIYHLWHGDIRDRWTPYRHTILARFGFDPFETLSLLRTAVGAGVRTSLICMPT